MSINDSYNEEAIVEAIAVALDNFYTNLIKKVDSLNIKAVMKRKNPYLFRAKAMNGAAQIIDAILAAFVSSSEETIFGNVFFEPIATAAAQGQKAFVGARRKYRSMVWGSKILFAVQGCNNPCNGEVGNLVIRWLFESEFDSNHK